MSTLSYDAAAAIGFVHPFPLAGVPYTRFFDDVLLVTDQHQQWLDECGWSGRQRALGLRPLVRERMHQDITSHSKFMAVVKDIDRRFVAYAPFTVQNGLARSRFIMNSPRLARMYENKWHFRERLAPLIRIPEYTAVWTEELKPALFTSLKKRFGPFVLQLEDSIGSRGTYVVHTIDDYQFAIGMLAGERHKRVVISQYINGSPAGTQVCITAHGIFVSGVHFQVSNCPTLCNVTLRGAMKWGGGEVAVPVSEHVAEQVRTMAMRVGEHLAAQGYKGIFGIDLMVTPAGEVYAIEVNARMTGFTYILSELQSQRGDVPYLLLHALEVGDIPYDITDPSALPKQPLTHGPVSILVCSNTLSHGFGLDKPICAGVYRLKANKLQFQQPSWSPNDLRDEHDVLLICRYNQGNRVPGGAQILKVMVRGETLNGNDLNARGKALIGLVRQTFGLPAS